MPQPQRVRPHPILHKSQPSNNGYAETDVLSYGTPVEELFDNIVHMLLYGRNGVGKTTLACEWVEQGPLALISLEPTKTGGARSVLRKKGVEQFTYRKFVEKNPHHPFAKPVSATNQIAWLADVGEKLTSDTRFATVVIDSGSSLDEIVLAKICGWTEALLMNRFKKVSNDQYTERSEQMRYILRPFLNLDKNVILICNEKDHNFQDQEAARRVVVPREAQLGSFFAAAMGGGTTKWVQDGCDYVCQLYMGEGQEEVKKFQGLGKNRREVMKLVPTGEYIRRLRLKYHPNFSARIRGDDPENIPDFVDAKTSTEMYQTFMQIVKGEYKIVQ